jgi:release factor glutamine methyltransferase
MSAPGSRDGLAEVAAALRHAGCVFAEDEADLLWEAADGPRDLAARVARRVSGEPLELVLGWAEFCGARIAVAPGVFVPRRRTEALAAEAVARTRPGSVVVDLCCGAGALGAAVAAAVPGIELHAADVDPAAVTCARRNLPGAAVHRGDLFAALPAGLRGRVDVLVANAPYVPTAAIGLLPREARDHEPAVALDGGDDGLSVVRRIVAGAPAWLAPGGAVLFETGAGQSAAAAAALRAAGFRPLVVPDEERGATVLVGDR